MAAQPPLLFVVGEHGELDDPGKIHLVGIVELQVDAEPLPQGVQGLAGDLELVGHEDQEVARLGPHPLADLGQEVRAEVLGDRRGQRAALFDLEPGQPLGPEVLYDERREFVDVFPRIAAGRPLDVHAADPIAALGHLAKDAELGLERPGR